MKNFNGYLDHSQVAWRATHLTTIGQGIQNGHQRPWILPKSAWEENIWPGVRNNLGVYVRKSGIQVHQGAHNLKSSWALCANLYFPFGRLEGQDLLAAFLQAHVSQKIVAVDCVELEFAAEDPLDPKTLLGEPDDGMRGSGQTSPDVAFIVRTDSGPGLILTENKFAEHSFYPCSGRKRDVTNPNSARCLNWPSVQANPAKECWQIQWATVGRKPRKYWNYIRLSAQGKAGFTRCPAATAGYQLFRQQALAEAISQSGNFSVVASCVAYDERNDDLINCLDRTGVPNFARDWGSMFSGTAVFSTWTHQEWVEWVRQHDQAGYWSNWLTYVHDRYDY